MESTEWMKVGRQRHPAMEMKRVTGTMSRVLVSGTWAIAALAAVSDERVEPSDVNDDHRWPRSQCIGNVSRVECPLKSKAQYDGQPA